MTNDDALKVIDDLHYFYPPAVLAKHAVDIAALRTLIASGRTLTHPDVQRLSRDVQGALYREPMHSGHRVIKDKS